MRKRNEKFIWAQNRGKWLCPATAGNAKGGAWGHTCSNCRLVGLGFLAVTYLHKELASKDRVKVFLSLAGAGGK